MNSEKSHQQSIKGFLNTLNTLVEEPLCININKAAIFSVIFNFALITCHKNIIRISHILGQKVVLRLFLDLNKSPNAL